jgi:hypothetical protein
VREELKVKCMKRSTGGEEGFTHLIDMGQSASNTMKCCARSGCSHMPQAEWRTLNCLCVVCVKGHQELNLTLRSQDRSVANASR